VLKIKITIYLTRLKFLLKIKLGQKRKLIDYRGNEPINILKNQ
jgi:hypothetical protein